MGSAGLISVCVNAQSSPWAVPGSGMFVPSPRALSHLWLRLGTLIPPLFTLIFALQGHRPSSVCGVWLSPGFPRHFPFYPDRGLTQARPGLWCWECFVRGCSLWCFAWPFCPLPELLPQLLFLHLHPPHLSALCWRLKR